MPLPCATRSAGFAFAPGEWPGFCASTVKAVPANPTATMPAKTTRACTNAGRRCVFMRPLRRVPVTTDAPVDGRFPGSAARGALDVGGHAVREFRLAQEHAPDAFLAQQR